MYKLDLALNNLQWWYAIKLNQTNSAKAHLASIVEYTDCFSAEG